MNNLAEEKKIILEKWNKERGIEDENLAIILETNIGYSSSISYSDLTTEEMTDLVIATWQKMKIKDFLNIQPALGPTSLVSVLQHKDDGFVNLEEAVAARVVKLDTRYSPLLPLKDNLNFYSLSLALDLDGWLIRSIFELVPSRNDQDLTNYDFIICGSNDKIINYLKKYFVYEDKTEETDSHVKQIGVLGEKTKVYSTKLIATHLDAETFIPATRIIAGQSKSFERTTTRPFVFCPYVFLMNLSCANPIWYNFTARGSCYYQDNPRLRVIKIKGFENC